MDLIGLIELDHLSSEHFLRDTLDSHNDEWVSKEKTRQNRVIMGMWEGASIWRYGDSGRISAGVHMMSFKDRNTQYKTTSRDCASSSQRCTSPDRVAVALLKSAYLWEKK